MCWIPLPLCSSAAIDLVRTTAGMARFQSVQAMDQSLAAQSIVTEHSAASLHGASLGLRVEYGATESREGDGSCVR